MSRSLYLKTKATWTPEIHKTFVDLCLEETLKGNRPGTHLNKEGWKNVVESFREKTGLEYDRKQLKNHWDHTKDQWIIWCKLINTSSMRWDPETNTFGASDDDWAGYIEENPEAAPFQIKELQDADKLEIIYDFAKDMGVMETSFQHKRQRNGKTTSVLHTEDVDMPMMDENSDRLDGDENQSKCGRRIVNEQCMRSSSAKKTKVVWTPDLHNMFIDLCLDEVVKGNRPGTHFTREGWKNIVHLFNEKAGFSLTRIQLKNHWDTTKEQWRVWCKLVGTGNMKWDPISNKFGASQEDWFHYLKANPEAASFRFKGLPLTEKLEYIFNGTMSTGERETPISPNDDYEAINTAELVSPIQRYNGSTSSFLHMEEPATENRSRMEPFSNAADSVQRSAVTTGSLQGKPSYGIGECIQCLDGMEEVDQGSELYMFALDIFLKKEYREIFLQLKKPSLRIAWLQRQQSAAPPPPPPPSPPPLPQKRRLALSRDLFPHFGTSGYT